MCITDSNLVNTKEMTREYAKRAGVINFTLDNLEKERKAFSDKLVRHTHQNTMRHVGIYSDTIHSRYFTADGTKAVLEVIVAEYDKEIAKRKKELEGL